MTAVVGVVAGLLQLTIPSYAWRLVRRYGTHRVGWFLVTSFLGLALLHLVAHTNPNAALFGSDVTLNAACLVAAVLLLIGMGHTEILCSTRDRLEREIRQECSTQIQADLDQLTSDNRALSRQIVLHQHNQNSLKQSEAQYRSIFFENPDPMWIVDRRRCGFLAVNKAALRLYGLPSREFTALTLHDLLADPSEARFEENYPPRCSQAQSLGRWQHRTSDGRQIEVELAAIDLDFDGVQARLMVVNELTERVQRENRLRRSQTLDAVARFSDGIARHFHQMFLLVERNVAFVVSKLQNSEFSESLQQLSATATRGSRLTRQMMAISGRYLLKQQPLDLNALIRSLHQKITALSGDRILVQYNYGCYQAPVMADSTLLEHVIVGLVLNARDAMPDGGTLLISTGIFHSDDAARPGEFVRFDLRDTGCGMAGEIQDHLFEPFVSTKDPTRALGLGLATAHGIIKQHGGWIECVSAPDAGTEISLFLPCAPASTVSEPSGSCAGSAAAKGTVLLVEPDDRTRALARCTLNWNGYRVIEADSSSLAIVLWETHAGKIDLLLTNFSFTDGLSGIQLAQRLQELVPMLKVIYFADASTAASTPPLDTVNFLRKPYTPDRLLREIETALQN